MKKQFPSLINLRNFEKPIKKETCFGVHKDFCVSCEKSQCRYWQNMSGKYQNCIINAANEGPLTLQDVGEIFNVTRMRICQIEKGAKQSLNNVLEREDI
jgi:hypothetical protein